MVDVLGSRSRGIVRMRGAASDSVVASFSAVEAMAFLDTFGAFGGGKLG